MNVYNVVQLFQGQVVLNIIQGYGRVISIHKPMDQYYNFKVGPEKLTDLSTCRKGTFQRFKTFKISINLENQKIAVRVLLAHQTF